MTATILPWAIILPKTHKAAVSMMAKGCIVVCYPVIWCGALSCNICSYTDKREVLQQEYSQLPKLLSPHFRWAVKLCMCLYIMCRMSIQANLKKKKYLGCGLTLLLCRAY